MNYLELVQARTDLALKFSSWGNAAPILRDDVPELIRRLRIAEQALDSAQELLGEARRCGNEDDVLFALQGSKEGVEHRKEGRLCEVSGGTNQESFLS